MDMRPLWQWAATDLHRAYRERRITPLEAVRACLTRIEAVDPTLNAMVGLREQVLEDAADSTERFARGQPLSDLDGIPLSIKDNLPTADMVTTWGCASLQRYRPDQDERAVMLTRAAGALIVGKTNVPEFTLEGFTDNRLFGTTRNPWNPALTPGGSSGGAAAGVAAGMFPLAVCTDGGGSIRRPASHCGLVGLKPSIGTVARDHMLPSLLLDFEVVGPIARTVADARLLFEAMRGPSPGDRRSLAAAGAGRRRLGADALRVLYVPTLDGAPVDPAIACSCAQAARRLRQMGHEVLEADLPLQLDFMTSSWPVVGQVGLAWMFSRHPQWRDQASEKYLAMAEQGREQSAVVLWEILETVERLRRDCVGLFEHWDLIMTPAAAALPWPAAQAFPTEIAGRPVGPRGHAIFTGWVNAAGLPAIALPCEPAPGGLPIGFQLIADYGADEFLLDVAESFEAAAPWAERRPIS